MPDVRAPAADVTIVIPAKNELRTIGLIVSACRRHADRVIVVDGHSTDGTAEAAAAAGAHVVRDRGRGKGDAIRVVIPLLTTEYVVFLDADGSHDPDDTPRLLDVMRNNLADHVSASRLIGGSSELHGGFDEFFRLSGNAFITACINVRFRATLSDSQNGFRALRTSVLQALDLREDLTTIEQEMIMKTLKLGYRMAEVPSHERRREYGTSHIRVSRVWPRYVYVLVRDCVF